MKFNRNWKEKKWVPYTIAACSAVVLFVVLSNLNIIGRGIGIFFHFIAPVIYGAAIAFIFDPLATLYQNKVFGKMKSRRAARGLGVLLCVLTVVVLLVLLAVAVIPQLIDSGKVLISNISSYIGAIRRFINYLNNGGHGLDLSWLGDAITNVGDKLQDMVASRSGGLLGDSIRVVKGLLTIIISAILSVYFLVDKERVLRGIRKFFRDVLPEKRYEGAGRFGNRCVGILKRYVTFNLVDGLLVGVVNAAFMLITRMPYAALISTVVGVTNLVPTFGPIVGGAIGAFILVLINPWYALWFLVFTVVLQTVDGYVLKPKLYGNTFGVSSLWVLIMIIVGGRIGGVWGILIAIPLSAILSIVFKDFVWKPLKELRQKKEKKDGASHGAEAAAGDAAPDPVTEKTGEEESRS